ncbi:MAG TPA: hypothetical protein VHK91_11885 [Flavisolibacter sp.]|jgi:hypothetical protein|nr:hypothetical protein [Flavisolibacter sp.]
MELHLKIIGFILILLAMIHLAFPRYFKWEAELASLSLINRQLMYVHTFFIALAVFLMGVLCITAAPELITTALGRKLSLGLAVFWVVRLYVQVAIYSSRLWKGKPFETAIHVLFLVLWSYFSVIFFLCFRG